MRISEGICEYNTGYLRTISDTDQACGFISSLDSDTTMIAKNTVRLCLTKKRTSIKSTKERKR